MKKLKKVFAIILTISIVATSTLTSLAVEKNVELETTKSKIVDQLKKDLGEDKFEEITIIDEEIELVSTDESTDVTGESVEANNDFLGANEE